MESTFHTLIYASARIDVDELGKVRKYLERLMGKEFVKRSETDESCVNKIVSHNPASSDNRLLKISI